MLYQGFVLVFYIEASSSYFILRLWPRITLFIILAFIGEFFASTSCLTDFPCHIFIVLYSGFVHYFYLLH